MPSTYTLNNGIELIATGEQSGTWGDTTNTNLELLDTALDGQVTVTLASAGSSGSPNTLPISDGVASNGRNRMVIFDDSSDLGATAYVQLTPNDAEKIIYVRNSLSGSRSIILFQGTYNASNDYEVPAGTTAVIFFDGAGSGAVAANVFNNAHFDALNVDGDATFKGASYDMVWDKSDNALEFADNAKAIFGAGSDLQIYHDGSDSYVKDNGDGDLYLQGTANVRITNTSGQKMFLGQDGGEAQLYHNGSEKLATTSTGIDVTGAITATKGSAGTLATFTDGVNSNFVIETASLITTVGNTGGSTALAFKSANTERMRIDSGGRVGIGTSSPSSTFRTSIYGDGSSIIGGVEFRNAASGGSTFTIGHANATSPSATLNVTDAANLIFKTNDTEAMRIDSIGNVGIGTTSIPSDVSLVVDDDIKLEVATSATTRVYAKSTGTGAYALGSSGGSAIAFHRLSDNSDEIGFETHHAGNNHTERMRLNYHGQLAIEGTGTTFDTTPSKNGLQLYYESDAGVATVGSYSSGGSTALTFHTNSSGGASSEAMRIASTGELLVGTTSDTMPTAAAAGQAIQAGTRSFIATETGGDTILGGTTGSNFTAFYQGGTERMRINAGGLVGIGTTDPLTVLDLGQTAGQKLMLWSSGTTRYGISVETSELRLFAEEQAIMTFGGMARSDGTTYDEHMRIDANGRVGIGCTPVGAAGYANQLEIGSTSGGMLILTDTNTTTDQKRHFIAHPSTSLKFGRLADDGSVTSDTDMVITYEGKIGMGTASPASLLSLQGDGLAFRIDGSSLGSRGILLRSVGSGANEGLFQTDGSLHILQEDASNYIRFSTANTERVRIDSSGRFLVGSTSSSLGGSAVIAAGVQSDHTTGAQTMTVYNSSASCGANGIFLVGTARTANTAYDIINAWSNAINDKEFKVRGDGNVFCDGSFTGGGADYAEYFEWSDGNADNEDRRGHTVVLDNEKIRKATSSDAASSIIGVISGNPSVVGDGDLDRWKYKYLRDDFGGYALDENGDRVLNPDYDPDQEYTSREDRIEWDTVGLMGKLRIRKGQPTGSNWIKMRDVSDTVEEWLVR